MTSKSSLYRLGFLLFFVTTGLPLFSQDVQTTLGVQLRPMLPSGLFDNQSLSRPDTSLGTFSIEPKAGFSAGVVLRQGLFGRFAFESGINYTKRVYILSYDTDSIFTSDTFRHVGYEIPMLGLIYVPMSDYSYMNAAFGISLDIFPNDIATSNERLRMVSPRNYWILPGLMANVGTEFRTQKSGFFYVGLSYHRMLLKLGRVVTEYRVQNIKFDEWRTDLTGHYFSIDFKYFFPTQRTTPPVRQ